MSMPTATNPVRPDVMSDSTLAKSVFSKSLATSANNNFFRFSDTGVEASAMWVFLSAPPHACSIAASGSGSASRWSVPTSSNVAPLVLANSSESTKGTTSSARLCRITVSAFTVLTVPYFFHAGQSSTSLASPLSMFMATAPPRLDPTTTCDRCVSNSAWAVRTASAKSSSSRAGLTTS